MIILFGRGMLFGSCLGDLDGGGERGVVHDDVVVARSLLLCAHRGGSGWSWCARAMTGLGRELLHLYHTTFLDTVDSTCVVDNLVDDFVVVAIVN